MTFWLFAPNELAEWAVGLLPYAGGLFLIAFLDAAVGAVEAWYRGEFSWEYFPEFLKTFAVFLVGWLVLEVLAVIPLFLNIQISGFIEAMANYGPKALLGFIAVSKYMASIFKHIDAIKDIVVPEPRIV